MVQIDINKKLHGSNGDMDLKVNFTINQGEFIAISGQSGSGKTTLLRVLAGLEDADGTITVDGDIWQDTSTKLSVQKRQIGFVFQDYALFPNMSIIENLLFVKKDKDLAKRLLKITELEELANRYPHTLSGGQQQRVSLARAMMNQPKLLLMDEPLSALDPYMRNKLQNKIVELHNEFKTTTIMVSHDKLEIYKLANRVIEINNGKIVSDKLINEVLDSSKDNDILKIDAEILAIQNDSAKVYLNNQVLNIKLTKEQLASFNVGDIINLDFSFI